MGSEAFYFSLFEKSGPSAAATIEIAGHLL
jgi:hypothetical protein